MSDDNGSEVVEQEVETAPPVASEISVRDFREGLYTDIPFEEYKRIVAINGSTLKWGEKSAAHLKAAIDGHMSKGDTAATLFGRAWHARLLEPDVFRDEYNVAGTCGKPLKSGVNKGKPCGLEGKFFNPDANDGAGCWYCGKHVPMVKDVGPALDPVPNLLSVDVAARIERAAKNVEAHPVMRLIKQRGGFETTILFTIRDMGLESCPLDAKIRLDKLIVPVERKGVEVWPTTIVDLKKVQVGEATDEAVAWSINKWKYDASAAFYVDGLKRATGKDARFVWIFVEDGYPYEINVIEADEETLQIGRMRYSDWLGKYAVGRLTGEWPGHVHGTRIKRGGLPEKIRREFFGRRHN